MIKLRIYTDTSVIGGYYDDEFMESTRDLFRSFAKGENKIILSNLTLEELEGAPFDYEAILNKISEYNKEYIYLNEETIVLARRYIKEGVISENNLADAYHISLATVNRVDVLVSWNFKHIVNIKRIYGYNGVNIKMGYKYLDIRSPKEVI